MNGHGSQSRNDDVLRNEQGRRDALNQDRHCEKVFETYAFPSCRPDYIDDFPGSSRVDNQILRFCAAGAEAHGSYPSLFAKLGELTRPKPIEILILPIRRRKHLKASAEFRRLLIVDRRTQSSLTNVFASAPQAPKRMECARFMIAGHVGLAWRTHE